MTRLYAYDGLAGCVVQRVSRETGRRVGLYHAEQAALDADSGPWATICETHGTILNHRKLALARAHLANPEGWCEICAAGD